MQIRSELRPALVLFVALTILTGVLYPLVVTGVGHAVLPDASRGSLVESDGKVIGSTLIGQSFTDPKHFRGRPSATSPQADNASASGGSNLGPLNPALVTAVQGRIDALKAADQDAGVEPSGPIPVDLVTASASGLDPEISPAAALWQAPRVAKTTGIPIDRIRALVAQSTTGPQWGFLGMPRVNVLALNRAIDAETASRR